MLACDDVELVEETQVMRAPDPSEEEEDHTSGNGNYEEEEDQGGLMFFAK